MYDNVLALFYSGKLTNYAWFIGRTVLGIAAIAGMAWAYCGLESRRQKCRTSGGAIDTCAVEKSAGK